ncbi:LexA family transcriptional regulator [Pseudomonas sp. DCB_BI]|uniref:LexA family transcriptional regulator n=1 Tax=Pseudomonas sp. DCB_BI TaxID=2993594 RepID=UPI00224AFF37|nr:LexA family transcriptional regulator [Pseudomonas sp. DCB_BI]MCX2891655.1 LexA family transcriptional regulator [Pseudomonas sp. DCB_BI]
MTAGIVARQYRRYWCREYRWSYHLQMTKNSRKVPLSDWQVEDAQRLKALYNQKRAELGLTQDRIAAELGEGVTQGAVSHFMNGRTALSLRAAAVFARALQVPISEFSPKLSEQLASMQTVPLVGAALDAYESYQSSRHSDAQSPLPEGADEDELDGRYAYVPQYDAKAAAGLGSENPHVEIRSTLAFKRDWLKVKGAKADQLIVIYAEGQSMWPTINDRDVLLIDRSRIDPVDRKVFVLAGAEGTIVKRLVQAPLGRWILRSDNDDKDQHPDRYFLRSDDNEHRIIGQVIWRGGDL